MKSPLLFVTILLVIMNISIPSSFKNMNSFISGTSIALNDFIESDTNNNDGKKEDNTVEVEEVENLLLLMPSNLDLYTMIKNGHFFHFKRSLISLYTFSIYVPPLF